MTALLNMVVPVVILVFIALAYRDWKKHFNKLRIATNYVAPMVLVVYLYQLFQPSYLPKGDVPKLKRIPFSVEQYETEDRLRKPKQDDSERQERFNSMMDHRDEINKILNN